MKQRRDLILGFVVGILLGALLASATGLSLQGTAGDNGDNTDSARVADDRVLYRLTLDQAEEWLLSYYDLEEDEDVPEAVEELRTVFESMREYTSEEDALDIFGRPVDIGPADNVMAEAYARVTDQDVANVEELDVNESEDGLQIIIGEWADPYALGEGPVLQFYLKVPPELTENLPKEWEDDSEILVDKPLETTIFWQSLRVFPPQEDTSS